LDIEEDSVGQYWSTSFTTNQNFYAGLIAACQSNGIKCGVYSNLNNWNTIFGSSTFQVTNGNALPVWFAKYDGVKSFASYSAFGQWSVPAIKQFSPSGSQCGLGFDINWFSNAAVVWSGGGGGGGGGTSSTGTAGSSCTGACVDTSLCAGVNGKSTPGLCAGASNIQCCTPITCSWGGVSGNCITTTQCTSDHGTSHAGVCPGAANIQCCLPTTCTFSGTAGQCLDTTSCGDWGGTSHSGLCPGASNIQCCIRGGTTGADQVDFQGFTFDNTTDFSSTATDSSSGSSDVNAAVARTVALAAVVALVAAVASLIA